MLFKTNGRSFEFCLLGLSNAEYTEFSGMIIENGGVLCNTTRPPAITFSNHNRFGGMHPIFHVNYIRECVRRGELLQLIHFKFGVRGFYGCLMYIFTHGKYSCPCICDIDPRCSSTQIDSSEEPSLSVNKEHNYAQNNCAMEQESTCSSIPPTSLDFLPQDSRVSFDGSPQDLEFLPDESLSSINLVVPENEGDTEVLRTKENDFVVEVPEPTRFEKVSAEQNTCSPEQLNDENTNQMVQTYPTTVSEEIFIDPMQPEEINYGELSTQQAVPSLKINELHLLSAAEEETEVCADVPVSVENEILLDDTLQKLQMLEQTTFSGPISPIFKSSKIKKKTSVKNPVVKDQPVASGSRTAFSPTVLRDSSNLVKILEGGTKQALQRIEEFRLTSSDSDDTDYNPTTVIINSERRSSVDQNSSFKSKEAHSKRKVLRKYRKMPGLSIESDDSDDAKETEGRHDTKRTGGQSKSKKQLDKNDQTSCTQTNISRVSNDDRSTLVSSTRSSDDVILVSDVGSDTSSEFDAPSSPPHRTVHHQTRSNKTSIKNENAVAKRSQRMSRNYLPWEQREMIKYLINTRCISEGKGNRVWKQMIEDGYLTHRTYLSLNNHFRKCILPHIHRFSMKSENMKKFRKLLE